MPAGGVQTGVLVDQTLAMAMMPPTVDDFLPRLLVGYS